MMSISDRVDATGRLRFGFDFRSRKSAGIECLNDWQPILARISRARRRQGSRRGVNGHTHESSGPIAW